MKRIGTQHLLLEPKNPAPSRENDLGKNEISDKPSTLNGKTKRNGGGWTEPRKTREQDIDRRLKPKITKQDVKIIFLLKSNEIHTTTKVIGFPLFFDYWNRYLVHDTLLI
jgi:hypothetical protein